MFKLAISAGLKLTTSYRRSIQYLLRDRQSAICAFLVADTCAHLRIGARRFTAIGVRISALGLLPGDERGGVLFRPWKRTVSTPASAQAITAKTTPSPAWISATSSPSPASAPASVRASSPSPSLMEKFSIAGFILFIRRKPCPSQNPPLGVEV